MDIGDWYLNLAARCRLHHEPDERLEHELQQCGPLLRVDWTVDANDFEESERWYRNHKFINDLESGESSFGIRQIWLYSKLEPAIRPLSVVDHFHLGAMLPVELHEHAARERAAIEAVERAYREHAQASHDGSLYRAWVKASHDLDAIARERPPAFKGDFDDAIPRQLVQRTVRVDLGQRDDVLIAEFKVYLQSTRAALRGIGGQQPYRRGAESRKRPSRVALRTMAGIGVLPFLDVRRWARTCPAKVSDFIVASMVAADPDRWKELVEYADMMSDPSMLRAWFTKLMHKA